MPDLYDLRQDISERENLAAEHPEIVREIQESIARHRSNTPVKAPIFDARLEGITIDG